MNGLSLGLAGCLLAFGGFFVGRWSAGSTSVEVVATKNPYIRLVQSRVPEFGLPNQPDQQTQPTQPNTPTQPGQQAPNDPRELIPLGRGNGQQPGQGQQPQPGQGQQPQDCPIYIYQNGQLYQFPQPGQQPGQQPGNGQGQGPGFGGPQELIPLNPGPGSPAPRTPNDTLPTRPRANSNDNRS